jgi:DNA-binding CsgD family transcriptional regulator
LLKEGSVSCSEELCPAAEVLKSEFYNEWVNPQKLGSGLNGVFLRSGSLVGSLGVIRAKSAKAFGAEDKRFLRCLMPHLQRAMRLHRKTVQLSAFARTNSDALDHWTTAVLLLDHDGAVVALNHAASVLLAARDGLFIERGTLRAANARDCAVLRRFVCGAINRIANCHANGMMLIDRPSGKRPLHLLITPCVNERAFFGIGGNALVFVSDPEAEITLAGVLQRLYALTPAEAKVSELLASGRSVKEIAQGASVRENTVRIHLKNIFGKTGTKRQAELVKLILSTSTVRSD